VAILSELTAKLDPTKIRVTQGDLPAGDWIFNGQGMVFLPPKPATTPAPAAAEGEAAVATQEKVVVPLAGKMILTPVKAEEFGIIRQFGADMVPLAGAVAGAMLLPASFFGIMGGFAAGSMLGRNLATFSVELDDGRRFMAIADIKIFKRLKQIAKNKDE
jgi:hypothetical protein